MIEIDRSGWRRVRFGDVVTNTKETVKDHVGAGLDRVVALEHMEPGSLQLSGWQDAADGTTFTRRFRAGQTLFAKRRAYQRKVAYAEFDGVCSGDILALEAKPDELLPELLPFIVQSDAFFEYALRTSAGSLSPRTKWQDLATWEFELPPVDEQRRIAGLLWSVESTNRALRRRAETTAVAMAAAVEGRLATLGASTVSLASLWTSSPDGGCSSPPTETGEARVLSLAALGPAGYVPGQLKRVERTPAMEAAQLSPGDLLVSRSNTIDAVGRAAIFPGESMEVSFPDTMMRLRLDESRVRSGYVLAVLMSSGGRRHVRKYAAGTSASMKKINRRNLGLLPVPLPDLQTQEAILDEVSLWGAVVAAESASQDSGRRLRLRLSNEILGGGR